MSLTFHNMRRRRAAAIKAAAHKKIEKEPVDEVKEPVKQKKPSVRKTGAKNDSQSR